MKPEDLCPRPERLPVSTTEPLVPPISLAVVHDGVDPDRTDDLYAGRAAGYLYGRDAHPNADLLAEKCRELHAAEQSVVCGSGMAALTAVAFAVLKPGDHVVASHQLYGRSLMLWTDELPRFGVTAATVDVCDPAAVATALVPGTRLLVVETIGNPLLRVANLAELAAAAHARGAELLVDNTFAGPVACRPLEWGADWVMESLTKIMNGHSDVLLGLLCGRTDNWSRVPHVVKTYGLTPDPFSCWLAARGLGTLALRFERACDNALRAAEFLAARPGLASVVYPGLRSHPEHALARRQLQGRYGTIVTFTLDGPREAVRAFLAASRIPLAPSLGDLSTTLSHPETSSHRGLAPEVRAALGIRGGTLRLSVGIESPDSIVERLAAGLRAAAG